ncbi:MAG: YraN family protein [Clostridia bacterium]|nr:YraN family protein [Clostridia bacterium]
MAKVENRNIKLGKSGERQAQKYLEGNGWQILERNWKNPFGEVDIIAMRGEICAFIEVKTRLSDEFGAPSEAVTNSRKLKYIRGANYYFCNKNIDCTVRFDIIEIFKGQLNHIENAFTA